MTSPRGRQTVARRPKSAGRPPNPTRAVRIASPPAHLVDLFGARCGGGGDGPLAPSAVRMRRRRSLVGANPLAGLGAGADGEKPAAAWATAPERKLAAAGARALVVQFAFPALGEPTQMSKSQPAPGSRRRVGAPLRAAGMAPTGGAQWPKAQLFSAAIQRDANSCGAFASSASLQSAAGPGHERT